MWKLLLTAISSSTGWQFRCPPSALASLLVVLVLGVSGGVEAAPKQRYQNDLCGDFTIIGNTLAQDCRYTTPVPLIGKMPPVGTYVPGERACYQRDGSPDFFWTLDDWTHEGTGATTQPHLPLDGSSPTPADPLYARSQAVLSLPPDASVVYARLYWAATRFNASAGDMVASPDLTVQLFRPGVAGFELSLIADDYAVQYVVGAEYQYQSSVDITELVKGFGSGAYQVSDVLAFPLDRISGDRLFDAWWMVVFYVQPEQSKRHVVLFDGMDVVAGPSVEVTLDGFTVPLTAYDAKLGVVAFEGNAPEPDINDMLEINGVAVSNALNPANNFFNSTRSYLGASFTSERDRPWLNGEPGSMSGMDLDVVGVPVQPGDTSASVSIKTSSDLFWLGGLVASISTERGTTCASSHGPNLSDTIKKVTNLDAPSGEMGWARPGDILEYTLTAMNTGSDHAILTVLEDALPPGMEYVPGSLQIRMGGPLTDAAGDDTGEYDAARRTLRVRLGFGADSSQGGTLPSATSVDVVFRVKVNPDAQGSLNNQATITAFGQSDSRKFYAESRPDRFSPAGPTSISIMASLPPVPTINSPLPGAYVNTQRPSYGGTAQKGDTVFVSQNGDQVCSVKADALSGFWFCVSTLTLAEGGPYVVSVYSKDSNSNPSPTASRNFYVDTVVPTPSLSSPVQDGLVSTRTPLFAGNLEAYASLTLTVDGRAYGPIDVGLDETWSFTVPDPLPDGSHTLTATAIDRAGNTGLTSLSWSQDTKPPDVPVVQEPAPGARLFTRTPTFSGSTEPGSIVRVFLDDTEAGSARADENGSWRLVSSTRFKTGSHRAWAVAHDAARNTSGRSPEVAFSTSLGSPYGPGCTASPSATVCWPWALLLLGLPLRRRLSR
ncbi:DUF11 domain-containing protein [Archangium violaceum]|uniref:Ig-like domain-containing protein n=1 Tax=Archangium violaceum TaxID=83451 RepID=UPI00194E6356|nr:Ig-like domain-containing protein [Archangium violaceum]QRO01215.1 DUF11 domain-containing protein [Archangium violaceum]